MAIFGTMPLANGSPWSTATDGWSRQTSLASQGSVDGAPSSRLSEDAYSGLEGNDLLSKAFYRADNRIGTSTNGEADGRPMFGKTSSSKSNTSTNRRGSKTSANSEPDLCPMFVKISSSKSDTAAAFGGGNPWYKDFTDCEALCVQGPVGRRRKSDSDVDLRPLFGRTSSSKSDERLPGEALSGDFLFGKSLSGDALFGKLFSGSYADTLRARGEAIRHGLYSDYLASTFRSPKENKSQKQNQRKNRDVPLTQPETCTGGQPIFETGPRRLANTHGSVDSSQQQFLTFSPGHMDESLAFQQRESKFSDMLHQELNMLSPYQSQAAPGPLQQQRAMTSPHSFPMRGFRPPPGLE